MKRHVQKAESVFRRKSSTTAEFLRTIADAHAEQGKWLPSKVLHALVIRFLAVERGLRPDDVTSASCRGYLGALTQKRKGLLAYDKRIRAYQLTETGRALAAKGQALKAAPAQPTIPVVPISPTSTRTTATRAQLDALIDEWIALESAHAGHIQQIAEVVRRQIAIRAQLATLSSEKVLDLVLARLA